MNINHQSRPLSIQKVSYHDITALGNLFSKNFSDEVHPEHLRQRIRRIRQFYHLLRPISRLSPWVKNFFNIYVIKIRKNVAGFLQLSSWNRNQLHLDYIAVAKQYRGQGIGTWAVRKVIEHARANGLDILLEVKSDSPAYHLYKRLGFSTQTRILHYEKTLRDTGVALASPWLPGLRRVRNADRPQLYRLYRNSIPAPLQHITMREYQHFSPGLFVRQLKWIKSRLMKSTKREYVLEKDGVVIASLEIISYPLASSHMINLLLHQACENIRAPLVKFALYSIYERYGSGNVSTTIYDDRVQKQRVLERLGFIRSATYYFMARFSHLAVADATAIHKSHKQPARRSEYHGDTTPSQEAALFRRGE